MRAAEEEEEEGKNDIDICPSFASYSFHTTVETAARVAAEQHDDGFEFLHHPNHETPLPSTMPFFDKYLLAEDKTGGGRRQSPQQPRIRYAPSRFSLKQLFLMEASSAPSDHHHSLPPPAHPTMRKKSNSTGSSSSSHSSHKRCKFRDLLQRCQSEGTHFRLVTKKKEEVSEEEKRKQEQESGNSMWMVHRNFYSNKSNGGGDVKRKSYLPYRQDLLGTIF